MAKIQKKNEKSKVEWNFPLIKQNYLILLIGIGTILLGYLLMATGITETSATLNGKWNNFFAVDLAPIILVIGYCVIIPYGIIKYFSHKNLSGE
jgi:membrane protein CcdC involved in cytochrome C biogenesis